jgi:tRNA(Ser,Leu) C12 N-acetylase TAN1
MNRHPHYEAPPEPDEELVALDAGHFFSEEFGTTAAEQASREPLGARLARERRDIEAAEPAEEVPPRPLRIDVPGRWNVIATARPRHEGAARAALSELGEVQDSPFPKVLLMRVDDVGEFADALAQRVAADPAVARSLARVLPAQHTFHCDSLADLEAITAQFVDEWSEELADATFHVRCHRRGRMGDLDPMEEEDFLGDAIQRMLDARGTPGRVDFDDADVVIDVETLNDEGAISMWTREDLRAMPFLRID